MQRQDLIHELKDFYHRRVGRLVRRLIVGHIKQMWPDIGRDRLVGIGYALPYLNRLGVKSESFAVMNVTGSVHFWPEGQKGRVCLSNETELPLETESVDRLLLIHCLEHAQDPHELLQECWRILKSNGRMIIVVPNRLGLWARADWTPFGHGVPYTTGQIMTYLRDNMFVHERTDKALFMPPFRSFLVLRTAYFFESVGRYIFPGLAGVHLIEASKQIYAGVAVSKKSAKAKTKSVVGQAVPTS